MAELRVAKNMRELRELNKYTQEELSSLIHIARQTYSLYETGKRLPDLKTVIELSNLYHISVDALLYMDLSQKKIAEDSPGGEHMALLSENSSIGLTGPDARMVMNYKSFPSETQQEVREFALFKKKLLATKQKDN